MSIWGDMLDKGLGEQIKKEDEVILKEEADLNELRERLVVHMNLFLKKAKEAFNENDRYTCAIFYSLFAIAVNKDKIDIFIRDFLVKSVFVPDGKVTAKLSLDENQKKELVDSIFNRSSYDGLGHSFILQSFDFSSIEFANLPFETTSKDISFFDFIGICKQVERWPDIHTIF